MGAVLKKALEIYNKSEDDITLEEIAFANLQSFPFGYDENDLKFLINRAKGGQYDESIWSFYKGESNIGIIGEVYVLTTSEIKISKSLLELFLLYNIKFGSASKTYSLTRTSEDGKSLEVNKLTSLEIVAILATKHSEELTQLVSIKDFTFDKFDQELTRQANAYLDGNPTVWSLDHATIYNKGSLSGVYWVGQNAPLGAQLLTAANPLGSKIPFIAVEFANSF